MPLRTLQNVPGVEYDALDLQTLFAEDWNALQTIIDDLQDPESSNQIIVGTGAPSGGTGEDGDLYINDANGDVYKKVTGAWGSALFNITGPAGADGEDAEAGAQGAQGIQGIQGDPGADGEDGAPGADGEDGAPGADGEDGEGVATGGTVGQMLQKDSSTDFDTSWFDAPNKMIQTVVHAGTAGTARPTWGGVIMWIGSVEPTNSVNDDLWVDTSS